MAIYAYAILYRAMGSFTGVAEYFSDKQMTTIDYNGESVINAEMYVMRIGSYVVV